MYVIYCTRLQYRLTHKDIIEFAFNIFGDKYFNHVINLVIIKVFRNKG